MCHDPGRRATPLITVFCADNLVSGDAFCPLRRQEVPYSGTSINSTDKVGSHALTRPLASSNLLALVAGEC